MAHCAVTAAQPTKGYLRQLGMRGPRRQVRFVLRRRGETHPGQHRVGATAVQPPGVRCTIAYGSRVIGFPAGDYRRGPEAAGVHTTQDMAAGRSACLSTEGLRGSLRTGHHHTRQLVTADRKVPSTLQISAGAATTEEGGARQVQLQADILLIDSLQGARETCAGTSAFPPHQLQELQQAAVGLQARKFDRDGAARCP